MKYSKTALNQLNRWYRQILIKCALFNAAILLGAVGSANAATDIVMNSGSATANTDGLTYTPSRVEPYADWVSGPLNDTFTMDGGTLTTSNLTQNAYLYANGGTINVESGTLTIAKPGDGNSSYIKGAVDLTLGAGSILHLNNADSYVNIDSGDSISNGIITANSGTLYINSGTHSLTSGSAIAEAVALNVSNGVTLNTYGNVTLSDNDHINSATIKANSGNLTITGGEHSFNSDSSISNTFAVTAGDVTFANAGVIQTNVSNAAGILNINGGTLEKNITTTGTGEVHLADTGNNATISGGDVYVTNPNTVSSSNTGIIDAANLYVGYGTTKGVLLNQANQFGRITTTGNLEISGNSSLTNNQGANLNVGGNVVINEGGSALIAHLDDAHISGSILNGGSLEFRGGTNTADIDNYNSINGTVKFKDTNNSADISNQNTVTFESATANLTTSGTVSADTIVNSAPKLTNSGTWNVGSTLTNNSTITNDGTINLNGSDMTLTNTIDGEGETYVNHNVTLAANSVLSNAINIAANANLSGNADSVKGNVDIVENGALNLNGGTVTTAVTGSGTTNITGDVDVNDDTGSIASAIAVTSGSSLTANAGKLTGAIAIDENGALNLTGGTVTSEVSGDGTTNITGAVSVDDTKGSIANAIVVASGSSLTSNATNIEGSVANDGALNLTGGNVTTAVTGSGTTNIVDNGEVTVTTGSIANDIAVTSGSSLIANAGKLTGDVANDGALNLTGGNVTTAVTGSGTTNIVDNGAVTVTTGSIANDIAVTSGSSLTANAGKLTGDVANAGGLTITGGELLSEVTGAGLTTISGETTINAAVTQSGVTIASGEVTNNEAITADITVASGASFANNDTITGSVNNSGEMAINQGASVTGSVVNSGEMTVADVNSIATATGATITNSENSELTINKGPLAKAITNNGDLNLGEMTLAAGAAISGSGTTNLTGDTELTANVNAGDNTINASDDIKITLGSNTLSADEVDLGSAKVTMNVDRVVDYDTGAYEGGKILADVSAEDSALEITFTDENILSEQNSTINGLQLYSTGIDKNNISITNEYFHIDQDDAGNYIVTNDANNADTSAAAGNENNQKAAEAWNNANGLDRDTVPGALQKDLNLASRNDPSQYVNALTDVAPTDSAIQVAMVQEINKHISNQITKRLTTQGMSSGDAFARRGAWVDVLYNHAEQDSSSSTDGFKGKTTGLALGVDGDVNDEITVGLGYIHSNSDVDAGNRDIDIKGHNLFAYAKYQPAEWFVRGNIGYGKSEYKEKLAVMGYNNDAKYDVNNYNLNAYVGYDLANGITPEAGLRYTYIDRDNYKDALGQAIDQENFDVLTAVIGVRYAKVLTGSYGTITPSAYIAATYDLMTDDAESIVRISDSTYDFTAEKLDRFGIEAGVDAKYTIDNWDLIAGYELGIRDDYTSHTGMLKIRYNF